MSKILAECHAERQRLLADLERMQSDDFSRSGTPDTIYQKRRQLAAVEALIARWTRSKVATADQRPRTRRLRPAW